MPAQRLGNGPQIVALVDDEFKDTLDERPVLLQHGDGMREWLDIGPISLAAIGTAHAPDYYDASRPWSRLGTNAVSRLSSRTIGEIRESTHATLLVHSIGGEVRMGQILNHFVDTVNQQGRVTAFVGNASSAAADLLMHVREWVMLRSSNWMIHHSAQEREGVKQTLQGFVEYHQNIERGRWLRRVVRDVERPRTLAEIQEWRKQHQREAKEFHAFVAANIRINDVRDHVHRLIDQMLLEPYDTELEWTGDDLKRVFRLRTIEKLCETSADLARAFEEHTGLPLDARDMEPVRGFFEKVGREVA